MLQQSAPGYLQLRSHRSLPETAPPAPDSFLRHSPCTSAPFADALYHRSILLSLFFSPHTSSHLFLTQSRQSVGFRTPMLISHSCWSLLHLLLRLTLFSQHAMENFSDGSFWETVS